MIADLRLVFCTVFEVNKQLVRPVMSRRNVMQYQATRAYFPRVFSWFGTGSRVHDLRSGNRCEKIKSTGYITT